MMIIMKMCSTERFLRCLLLCFKLTVFLIGKMQAHNYILEKGSRSQLKFNAAGFLFVYPILRKMFAI